MAARSKQPAVDNFESDGNSESYLLLYYIPWTEGLVGLVSPTHCADTGMAGLT